MLLLLTHPRPKHLHGLLPCSVEVDHYQTILRMLLNEGVKLGLVQLLQLCEGLPYRCWAYKMISDHEWVDNDGQPLGRRS